MTSCCPKESGPTFLWKDCRRFSIHNRNQSFRVGERMFETALKQMGGLPWRSSGHIAKNLAGTRRCESGQLGDQSGLYLTTLKNQNVPTHECSAVMTGHFIGLKPSYQDPQIYIFKRTLSHKMLLRPRLLRMIQAAFGGHQPRPWTSQNGDPYPSIVCMLHVVGFLTSFTTLCPLSDNQFAIQLLYRDIIPKVKPSLESISW